MWISTVTFELIRLVLYLYHQIDPSIQLTKDLADGLTHITIISKGIA